MYWSANDLIFFFPFLILVGAQLLYNVAFLSAVQQSILSLSIYLSRSPL